MLIVFCIYKKGREAFCYECICLASSYMIMLAATEAFSDSAKPYMGKRYSLHISAISSETPRLSLPITSTQLLPTSGRVSLPFRWAQSGV